MSFYKKCKKKQGINKKNQEGNWEFVEDFLSYCLNMVFLF